MKRDDDDQQADTFFENTAPGLLESGVDIDLDASRARGRALLRCQALALQAAGLGLWEWEVTTGALIVDAHWAMTLGYAVAELEPHIDTIKRLENPEDRQPLASASIASGTKTVTGCGSWSRASCSNAIREAAPSGRSERLAT
jgi:hypothetical protein